jgi:putative ABC transport system permease protein
MLRNYLKIAWRNLMKNKAFSLINIIGLSAGIAFVLLVGAYAWSEFQVNKIIKENERTYILRSKWKKPDMGLDLTTPAPISKALYQTFPDLVENYYHHDGINSIVSTGDKYFKEALQPGDSIFLTMFGFPLLHGDARTALNDPSSLALTERKALKYFGTTDAIGKTLTIQSFSGPKKDFKVTAVLKDLPYNTITNFYQTQNEIFLPSSSLAFFGRDANFENWGNVFIINYVRLKKGVTPTALQKPIKQLLALNTTQVVQQNLEVYLSPLNTHYMEMNGGLARKMILTMSFVAFFILLMAIVNFINISIGNSITRLREIGVRKVMGSTRKQLIGQFLTESIVLVCLSVLLALFIYQVARPLLSDIVGKQIPVLSSFPLYFLALPFVLILLIGLLAGIYPAFVLSIQPSVDSLKGKLKSVKEKVIFRRSLIALQFTTAIIVFVAAVIIDKQVNYVFNNNLGYDKEQIITATLPRDWSAQGVQHMRTVRNEFVAMPEVEDASFAYEIPDGATGNGGLIIYKASEDSTKGIIAPGLQTDEYFASTYNIKMAAGNYLTTPGGLLDSSLIAINETAAHSLGWKDASQAVGEKIKIIGTPMVFTISGVTRDFHFETMHQPIKPLMANHVNLTQTYRYMSFKVKPGNIPNTLAALQKKWAQLLPGSPLEFKFMDDTLASLYQTELQMKKAAETATSLALVIVLLGVLGIVSLSIARRLKEVGIRKVLGASVVQIVVLFIKEFAWIILIANCIAWPVTWILLNNWLTNFAYRVQINLVPFITVGAVVAVLIGIVITLLTIKKGLLNPVKNLRSE